MDYITTIEMSKIWGISSRRISLLCSQGRVPGAEKKGKTWLIPKDAVKPTDSLLERKIDDVLEVIMLMGRPEHWYILRIKFVK